MINKTHVNYKKLNKTQKENIEYLHSKVDKSLAIMNENPVESNEYFNALSTWLDSNILLQDLWGFKRNTKYFKFWRLPKCICPEMDNDDRYPYGMYYHVVGCPVCELLFGKLGLSQD